MEAGYERGNRARRDRRLDRPVARGATANVIGKLANGIADDFLSSLCLATRAPVLLAPAMNANMLAHDAVQRNLQTLSARGVQLVEPGEGYLTCGWIGRGLAEPPTLSPPLRRSCRRPIPRGAAGGWWSRRGRPTGHRPGALSGNRSSGRMGFALAAEALPPWRAVTLVAGPTPIEPPAVGDCQVRSAAEMYTAVVRAATRADIVIMAAAVADYRRPAGGAKLPRRGPCGAGAGATRDILTDPPDGRHPCRPARPSWGSRPRQATQSPRRAFKRVRRISTSLSPTTCRGLMPASRWARMP